MSAPGTPTFAPVASPSAPGTPTFALATPTSASATSSSARFVALASTGIGTANIGDVAAGPPYYEFGRRGTVQTIALDAGIRLGERWMLGLHVGAASKTTFVDGWSDFMGTDETQYGVRTIQYGVTAQFAITDRVWLAPWLGVQDSMRRDECYLRDYSYPRPSNLECMPVSGEWDYHRDLRPAFGLTGGFDVIERDGHRLSIVGALVSSSVTPIVAAPDAPASYSSLSIAVAYRFWR